MNIVEVLVVAKPIMLHVWHIFTYICHRFKPSVGKFHSIHGASPMYGKLLEAEMSLAKWKSTDHWKTRLQHGILQARDAKHSIPCQSWVMVSNIFLYVYSSLEKIPILINILIDGLKPPSSKVSEYSYFAQGCPITASECFFGEGPVWIHQRSQDLLGYLNRYIIR